MRNPFRQTEGVEPQRLSATRLWGMLLLFLVLAAYSIWRSERFQNLIQGVSQSRLYEALGRPVTFRTVDFRVFPPSVRLADVRIANDPRLPGEPLLVAEEVSIGGGVSLVGQELRLGRIRVLRPQLSLVQFPDGSWNLPPGLGGPSGAGIKLHVGSILVQQGVFEFQGRKVELDGRFEDFAAELRSLGRDRYRGTLLSRRAAMKISDAEPVVLGLSVRFLLDSKRGLTFDEIRLDGPLGQIHATGALENFGNLSAVFSASADVSIEEAERIFHSDLGFAGPAHLRASVELPSYGGFRVSGHLAAPRVRAQPFTFEDFSATVVAQPEALVAEIERASYSGGRVSGVLRIGNLVGKPQPVTLALQGAGISLERFFGDLDLKGTGLSGSVSLTLGLRWGEAGLKHADGGGALEILPGPAVSLVRGRFGEPTSGGGPISVVNGRIGFEDTSFRFPQSTLQLTGGIRIGQWQPDFDLLLRSRDLSEVDRLFQNFVAATGGKPEPLGLGGLGEISGHLGGTWSNPNATVQLAAEESRYSGVLFGSVRGSVEMHDGAFTFRPLRVYDGGAGLSLEGMTGYRIVPGRPRFDLSVAARAYPLSRLLQYLDLRFPVEGRLTGSFQIVGTPEAATGGGSVELRDAVVWGQRVPVARGTLRLTPGRFAIDDLRAEIGRGMVGGSLAISVREKTFDAKLAGDGIALESIDTLKTSSDDLTGKLSFELAGSGSLERPDLKIAASLSQAQVFGHPVPDDREPRLEATVTKGVLNASVAVSEHWSLHARGDLFDHPARLEVALDVADLNSFLLLTPLEFPPGRGGSLALTGNVTLPTGPEEFPTGTLTVTRARLDLPERPGVLATSGEVRISLGRGRLTFEEFQAVGEGTRLAVSGSVGWGKTSGGFNIAVSGPLDAALLALAVPDLALTGRLRVELRTSGSLEQPSLSGSVRVENGKYRLTAVSQILDDINASITFQDSRADLQGRARFGSGELYAAGSFRFRGLSLEDFRLSVQGRHVTLRYPEDLQLIADAELVATGGPKGNLVRGEVVLLRGSYSKDFEVTLSDLLARSRPSAGIAARQPWKEKTALEVHIASSAALEVRNNLARLTATVDLVVRGTVAGPTLVGQIVFDEGGRVTFRDVRYEIESGTVAFANTEGFVPILDIRARAEVRGYDLVMSLVGTWPRIQTSFSSDPTLPDESILGLLLTGAQPGLRSTTDTTGQLASTAGGLVAGAVTGGLTRQTQRFFKLDRFEIDPVFSGSQLLDVRTTVGKQLTPNWSVSYSQSFDANKEPIVQTEYRISQTFVIRGRRDENGVYLVEFRRRQRF